nr:lipoprotein Hlp [uncultured Haemophilus sp.]
MTKLTKLSAIALLSAFLTACEKPAATNLPAKTETAAAQVENKVEETKAKVEEKAAEVVDTGAEDYKAFREWQKTQEQSIENAIATAVEKLGDKAKDEKLLRSAMNQALATQAELIKQSAEALQFNDAQVRLLKDKSLEALTLGTQLMAEGEKVAQQPTEDAHKIFSELQTKLDKVAQEGKAVEAELMKKYEAVEKVNTPTQDAPEQPMETKK